MVATSTNNQRAYEALLRVRRFIEEHGTPEQVERLNRILGGPVPAPRLLPEYPAYQSECLAILAEMVAELKEASKPRPRGRPRKEKAEENEAA